MLHFFCNLFPAKMICQLGSGFREKRGNAFDRGLQAAGVGTRYYPGEIHLASFFLHGKAVE